MARASLGFKTIPDTANEVDLVHFASDGTETTVGQWNGSVIVFTGGMTVTGTLAVTSTLAAAGVTSTGGVLSSSATVGVGYATGAGGAETQGTDITTTVAISPASLCGTITTQAASAAAAGEHTFTVSNTLVAATDVIVAGIKAYAGAGTPLVYVSAVAAGSFDITITNLHTANALDAAMTINWAIFKSVAA